MRTIKRDIIVVFLTLSLIGLFSQIVEQKIIEVNWVTILPWIFACIGFTWLYIDDSIRLRRRDKSGPSYKNLGLSGTLDIVPTVSGRISHEGSEVGNKKGDVSISKSEID